MWKWTRRLNEWLFGDSWKADDERVSSDSLRAVLYHEYTRGLDSMPVWRSPKEIAEMAKATRRDSLKLVRSRQTKLASGGRQE